MLADLILYMINYDVSNPLGFSLECAVILVREIPDAARMRALWIPVTNCPV